MVTASGASLPVTVISTATPLRLSAITCKVAGLKDEASARDTIPSSSDRATRIDTGHPYHAAPTRCLAILRAVRISEALGHDDRWQVELGRPPDVRGNEAQRHLRGVGNLNRLLGGTLPIVLPAVLFRDSGQWYKRQR
jgi:hypothetical protein